MNIPEKKLRVYGYCALSVFFFIILFFDSR
jgi:hypothetical protein